MGLFTIVSVYPNMLTIEEHSNHNTVFTDRLASAPWQDPPNSSRNAYQSKKKSSAKDDISKKSMLAAPNEYAVNRVASNTHSRDGHR